MPPGGDSPLRGRPSLDDALQGVIGRLAGAEVDGADRADLTRELRELRDLLAAERAARDAPARGASTIGLPGPAAPGDAAGQPSPSEELLGRLALHEPRYARYRLESEIGRGGMGAVHRAFDSVLHRTLAMKVALDRPDDEEPRRRQRTARFLEEAQITGQLDHPGIVPVHELGLDSRGRIYFTMRLVRGRDLLTVYEQARSERDGWSTTRVLGVLLKVCEAMAYAHSKGVIHRDLKPSNVMVGRFGEVYVMDWGLAKLIDRVDRSVPESDDGVALSAELRSIRREAVDRDPRTPLLTEAGTVLGTPAYMSPEQARGDLRGIDGRTDVFAVGAMLYHLLAGAPPYQDLASRYDAGRIWATVLEREPTPLAEIAPDAPAELVAITERAMSRDLAKRYPDMLALGEDLRAWLEGRVVRAYETGAWAHARKWLARNRALSGALAGGLLALIGGTIASSYFAVEAHGQATSAILERDTSLEVVQFLTGMLEQPDPARSRGRNITVAEVLDSASTRIDGQFAERPELQARLMHTMARVYKSLDMLPQSQTLLERALALRRAALGDSHADTLATLVGLAHLHQMAGRPELALPYSLEVLRTTLASKGEHHREARVAHNQLGTIYEMLGNDAAAEQEWRAAAADDGEAAEERIPVVQTSRNNLATLYMKLGRYAEARPLLESVHREQVRALGADSDQALFALTNRSELHAKLAEWDAAIGLAREVLERRASRDEADHPMALRAAMALGRILHAAGQLDEAQAVLRTALEGCRRVLPRSHQQTLECTYRLALASRARGDVAEAATLARDLLEATPADSPQLAEYQTLAGELSPPLPEGTHDDRER